jgi:hypothetical protein
MYAIPVVGALAVANVFIHMSHGHHDHDHDVPPFAYERKLLKKYPWSPDTCNLFDYECKAKAKALAHGGVVKGH